MYYISYRSVLILSYMFISINISIINITLLFLWLYRHINIVSDLNKRQVNSNGFEVNSEQ